MDIKRQCEIFKCFVKKVMKEKEDVSLNHVLTVEEVRARVKEFNIQNSKLSKPVTDAEFYELYFAIMEELVTEYLEVIKKKVTEGHK
jgi:hypothetical protein